VTYCSKVKAISGLPPMSERLRLLREVQTGCEKHPRYRGQGKPRSNCPTCARMFAGKRRLTHSVAAKIV